MRTLASISLVLAGAAWALAALGTPVAAQAANLVATAAPAAKAETTEGEVRKVDKDNRKITLRHGAIKNIDMPPMTMAFVAQSAMLGKVKVGDKVRFTAAMPGGVLTLTSLEVQK